MIIPPNTPVLGGSTSGDPWGNITIKNGATRPLRGAFVISEKRPSFVTYSLRAYIPITIGGVFVFSLQVGTRSAC